MATTELDLQAEPAAVPRARQFVRDSLRSGLDALADDAQVVVTELVTNAVLHGGAPIVLRVITGDSSARIEVQDSGMVLPVVPLQSTDAMTGRGLRLVASLAQAWGIDPVPGGKLVWAELGARTASTDHQDPEVDVEALLASWHDVEDVEPLYTVRLGSVPTELLLAAKSHIDNVVRELELARTEGSVDGPAAARVPARLIEVVTRTFASARNDIKRQAVDAAARGDADTSLVLTQPASAARAGEEYLTALDEADRYARAARLLTLEAPPVHRVFRRWYVQALVDQIRAQADGQPPPKPPTFLQVLSREVAALASLQESWDKLQLLQKVTAELTAARSVEEIASTVVQNATEALGALSGTVYLRDGDVLKSIAQVGGTAPAVSTYHELDVEAALPGPDVLRSGSALFLRNSAELVQRYPSLDGVYASDRALHVVPLTIDQHRLGVLTLSFATSGALDEATQLAFVQALADALAQALERSMALTRAAEARERLAFLADASVALSGSIDYAKTVDAVGDLLVPRLADWCVVQVLNGRRLDTVGVRHFNPEREMWADSMRDRYPTQMDSPTGAPNVLRTGVSELYPSIPQELLEQTAVDAEHLSLITELGMRSALVVPLTGRQGTIGAITLIYAESGRQYQEADVPFAEDVARRAALALETADTFREQSGRLADVTEVAVAAQRAILADPPSHVGPVSLSARYLSAAAEALVGGDLYEVVSRPGTTRLLIGDVRGKGLSAVRTATIVLGEFRAAAADLDDLVAVAEKIDQRLRPYLGDEDFVTSLIAEIHDDGRFSIASCGHPPALLVSGGTIEEVPTEATLPLGLGSRPVPVNGRLEPGDRLLLYTDGIIEARDRRGEFLDLHATVMPLLDRPLEGVLDSILDSLRAAIGPELGDDLALLVAEYTG
jgi:serine phosphatase RsbU (regulator of sigma subunit)/anti-sigma regulatory factor (Ser/Thr protein kinase)